MGVLKQDLLQITMLARNGLWQHHYSSAPLFRAGKTKEPPILARQLAQDDPEVAFWSFRERLLLKAIHHH